MLSTLVLVSMLTGLVAPPTPSPVSLDAGRASGPPSQFGRSAQRQPGGLPGMRDGDEDAGGGGKDPGRAKPAAPATRSVPGPKAQGRSEGRSEGGSDSDKKAPKEKKSPDAAK